MLINRFSFEYNVNDNVPQLFIWKSDGQIASSFSFYKSDFKIPFK